MNRRQSLAGFDFQQENKKYLARAKTTTNSGNGDANEATPYDVRIVPAEVTLGQRYWRVIGIRHLTPAENTGKHNLYADLLDEDGKRIHDASIRLQRGWEGQHADEVAAPVQFDKGDNEPATNIPIEENQRLWVRIDSPLPSDKVENFSTKHADERGPNGEIWNSVGHHSFYVVFQRTLATTLVEPVPVVPVPVVPVPVGSTTTPPVVTHATGSSSADDATYVEGRDGIAALTVMQPGQHFEQIWQVRNSGSSHWGDSYHLVCVGGNPLGAPTSGPVPAPAPTCAPGSEVAVHLPCLAPSQPGPYYSTWRVANAQGQTFGEHLWLVIVVAATREEASPAIPRNVRPSSSPEDPMRRLPLPAASAGAVGDPELYAAWKKHIEVGFENNQVMFKQLLEGFMNPYWTTVWMYRILFGLGVASFLVAAGLSAFSDKQGFVLIFGGLSALSLLAYFFNRPLQALEENLQFITWLGLVYNSYWTRLVYLNSQPDVQKELQDATDDAIARIKDLMAAHAESSGRRQVFPQQ